MHVPGGRLVVEEDGVRRVDHPVAALADPQAHVHVVEGHGQVLRVEATDLIEDRPPHHGAREGDGAAVADDARKLEVPGIVLGEVPEGVPAIPVRPQDHAGVLEAPVGVEQLGADDPDLGPLGVLEHRLDPVRRDHRDVVVEEDDVRGVDEGHRGVVDGRVIERFEPESPVP